MTPLACALPEQAMRRNNHTRVWLLQMDAVYMSPPWGGPSYSAKTFKVDRDVGGLGCNMHQLLASAFSLLPEGRSLLQVSQK